VGAVSTAIARERRVQAQARSERVAGGGGATAATEMPRISGLACKQFSLSHPHSSALACEACGLRMPVMQRWCLQRGSSTRASAARHEMRRGAWCSSAHDTPRRGRPASDGAMRAQQLVCTLPSCPRRALRATPAAAASAQRRRSAAAHAWLRLCLRTAACVAAGLGAAVAPPLSMSRLVSGAAPAQKVRSPQHARRWRARAYARASPAVHNAPAARKLHHCLTLPARTRHTRMPLPLRQRTSTHTHTHTRPYSPRALAPCP
jgi:hypothetical protein